MYDEEWASFVYFDSSGLWEFKEKVANPCGSSLYSKAKSENESKSHPPEKNNLRHPDQALVGVVTHP